MNKVAVFLDLTKIDQNILNYVKEMDARIHFKEIHLVHYVELQDSTDEFSKHFPDLDRPLEDFIQEELAERAIDAGIDENRFTIKIHTSGGYDKLLAWMSEMQFNLCVFGKKVIYNGTGVFSGKVSRLMHQSVLFVTETSRPNWEKILVPIDYSNFSEKSLKFASKLADELSIQVTALHVFQVPPVYFPIVKEKSEPVIHEVRKKAQKRINDYTQKLGLSKNLETDLIYANDKTIASCIYDYARSNHIDLIIMGFKGKKDDEEFLIGSVAERLIQSDRDLPVMLVQGKIID